MKSRRVVSAPALKPLADALANAVLAGDTLSCRRHSSAGVAPGTGKTKTGRLCTFVRDERPFAGSRPFSTLHSARRWAVPST
jgi:hypothetical protein